jgi:type II secretory pathway pseudopilin PulG
MRAVNLIPLDQREGSARAGRSHGAAYAVLGLLAGLAVLALLYGSARHQVSSQQAKAVALEAQAQRVQANAGKLAPYTAFIALRDKRLQAVSQLVDSRFDWAHGFHELGRVLPGGVSITSVTGAIATASGSGGAAPSSTSGASPTSSTSGTSSTSSTSAASAASSPSAAGGSAVASATPPGSVPTFTITGCAVNQSTVALTLERLRLMDGASVVTLQSSTKNSGSGGTASGSCPQGAPVFTVQVTFYALPVASAVSAANAKSIGGKR